jgi:large subunit ribosomal protein L25
MKLQMFARSTDKKSESKRIRREGNVPAVIYRGNKLSEAIAVNGTELSTIMRQVQPGRLPTTVFTLVDKDGKEHKAILKDIQYEITTYKVSHLDFEELKNDTKVNVKVPIECTGVVDCVGIKLGGVLRQVIRHLRVRCLPKDIPATFELDVRELEEWGSKRLSALKIPASVRPLVDLNEVAVVIVKR